MRRGHRGDWMKDLASTSNADLGGRGLSQLIAYYDTEPLAAKERVKTVEVQQAPIAAAKGLRSADGYVRVSLVYVLVASDAGPFLVPFGAYDDWSLRDRYNEAIRIMNTLGASEITCESFGESTVRRGLKAKVLRQSVEATQERIENSGFDFRHSGAGSEPRDPRPLRWPDEPGFSAAVSSVLDNGAKSVDIKIRSSRTHSVEGSIGIELKSFGFDLGGSTQSSGATTLSIHATFPQTRKGWR